MLRDNIAIAGLAFIGITLLIVVGNYIFGDLKQNTTVQGMTETARVAAMESVDNSSRVERGELYIDKVKFETEFVDMMKNIEKDIDSSKVKFEYYPESNNSNVNVEYIKVTYDKGGTTYQSTIEVDIAED